MSLGSTSGFEHSGDLTRGSATSEAVPRSLVEPLLAVATCSIWCTSGAQLLGSRQQDAANAHPSSPSN